MELIVVVSVSYVLVGIVAFVSGVRHADEFKNWLREKCE